MHVRGLNRHVVCESHVGGFAKIDGNDRFFHIKHNKTGNESYSEPLTYQFTVS